MAYRDILTSDELMINTMRIPEWSTPDLDRLRLYLDATAPIIGRFAIHNTPPGFAPEAIREDWVGVKLPVRAICLDGHVPILAIEAIAGLEESGKEAAGMWWRKYFADTPIFPVTDPEGYPEFTANITTLDFDPRCGTVTALE